MADGETSNKPNGELQEEREESIAAEEGSSPDGLSQDAISAPVEREAPGADAGMPSSSAVESAEDDGDDDEGTEREGEDEEAGECGFCLFMKSGPCKDNFIKWEECVEQADKAKEDIVDKCHKVTFLLKECMEQNSDYYEPVLQAEKAMSEEAESEALEASNNEGEGEKPTDSIQPPSDSPAQNQPLPDSEESSLPGQENSPSE